MQLDDGICWPLAPSRMCLRRPQKTTVQQTRIRIVAVWICSLSWLNVALICLDEISFCLVRPAKGERQYCNRLVYRKLYGKPCLTTINGVCCEVAIDPDSLNILKLKTRKSSNTVIPANQRSQNSFPAMVRKLLVVAPWLPIFWKMRLPIAPTRSVPTTGNLEYKQPILWRVTSIKQIGYPPKRAKRFVQSRGSTKFCGDLHLSLSRWASDSDILLAPWPRVHAHHNRFNCTAPIPEGGTWRFKQINL